MDPVSVVMGAPAAANALVQVKKAFGKDKPLLLPYHGGRSDATLGGRSHLNVGLMLRVANSGTKRAAKARMSYRSLAWTREGEAAARNDSISGDLTWTPDDGYMDSDRGGLQRGRFDPSPGEQVWALLGFVTQADDLSGTPTLSLFAGGQEKKSFQGPVEVRCGLSLEWGNAASDAWQAHTHVTILWDGNLVKADQTDPSVTVVFHTPQSI
jgi:hypothetical protein